VYVAKVIWHGDYDPTWEPLENLRHSHTLVKAFAARTPHTLSLLPPWFVALTDPDVDVDVVVLTEDSAPTLGLL
jgi:hypothetical protein